QDSESADFEGSGRYNTHLPHPIEIERCNVHEPAHSACGQQASHALFGADAQQASLSGFLFVVFRDLNNGNVFRARVNVALAPRIRIDLIVLVGSGHTSSCHTTAAVRSVTQVHVRWIEALIWLECEKHYASGTGGHPGKSP